MEKDSICHNTRAKLSQNDVKPSQDSFIVNHDCGIKQTDIDSDGDDLSCLLLDALSVASDVSGSTEQNEQMK
eukprot:11715180-Ditylum_brightwellii.AAC.1